MNETAGCYGTQVAHKSVYTFSEDNHDDQGLAVVVASNAGEIGDRLVAGRADPFASNLSERLGVAVVAGII